MPFVKVASVSELQPDCVMEVSVGQTPYALCNVGGRITALSGICPHRWTAGTGRDQRKLRDLPVARLALELCQRRK